MEKVVLTNKQNIVRWVKSNNIFACSIIADLLPILNYLGGWKTLLEDGSKLLGIASLLAYFWQFCSNLDFISSSEVIYFRREKRISTRK